jgi:hypothetical protein
MKGKHTGEEIAKTVFHLLKRADVLEKVSNFPLWRKTLLHHTPGWILFSRQCEQQRILHAIP